MLFDIARLRYTCLDLLIDGHQRSERHAQHETVMRHHFASEQYSNTFYAKYLASMLSALWGINAGKVIDHLPVKAFVRCLLDHSILCPRPKRLKWQCINDGARQLILVLAKAFPSHRIHVKTRVTGISRSTKESFVLMTSDGQKAHFDHLIFAISASEIQQILGTTRTSKETEILQKLQTARHIMVLHSDPPVSNASFSISL
jgi:predicted NAD/FAD-binding protein